MNRIEEVKKILDKHKGEFICNGKYQDITNVTIAKEINDYYSQLFPQPLDDKELREKIAEATYEFVHRGDTHMTWAELPYKWGKKAYYEFVDILYPALLQPKIEEVLKLERDYVVSWLDDIFQDEASNVRQRDEACRLMWQALKK